MYKQLSAMIMACCMAAGVAHGASGYYKWVDDQGVIHYSQSPPANRPAEELPVPGPATGEATPAQGAPPAQQAPGEASQPQEEAESPATPADADQQQAESQAIGEQVCNDLRDQLARLERYTRLYQRDDQGNVTWLTQEERQQRIDETKKQLSELCKE
jgi:hypothetical protein